ncbi:hypothetical protein ACLMVZ_002916 [Klebsiella aerogenes]
MTKSTITREQAQKIIVAADEVITALAGNNEDVHPDDSKKMCDLWDDLNDRYAPPEVVRELARMALAAMDSESGCLPLDYLQGHKDGLEWAAQLAEANHPETGDWLYDDPIELAKAIRKGPDMPPVQLAPVVSEDLYKLANHIASSKNGLPDEWQDWAEELESDIRRAAMLQPEPVTTANKLGSSPVIPDGSKNCPCCGKRLRRSCSVEGCGGKHVAHGLCKKHYDMKRWEDPEQVRKFREAGRRYRGKKKSTVAAPQEVRHD